MLAGICITAGIVTDLVLKTASFPIAVCLFYLVGMILAHFPLKRTGRALNRLREPKEWWCTSRLVTTDIYKFIRHPHYLGIGIFMTSLGLLIGYLWSFLIITISQWVWVIAFLLLVEEKELIEKFGFTCKA